MARNVIEMQAPSNPSPRRNYSDNRRDSPTQGYDHDLSLSLMDLAINKKGSVIFNKLTYGLQSTSPQCDCRRISIQPLLNKERGRGLSKLKLFNNPVHIKKFSDRCSKFNQWWLKCCQSVTLKQNGIYWNLVRTLESRIRVDGVERNVAELVLGARTVLAISLDIKRTYPSLRFYAGHGRRLLRRVLMAYAFFDPEVGYVQGLNFVAANLLWHSSEEQAFWALISVMYLYDLRSMFLAGLPGVFKRCDMLQKCMIRYLPELERHLRKVGVHIPMVSSDWFMTLCANTIPVKPLSMLWDNFFSCGWITIFKFILYRLKQFEEYLLSMVDVADIMKVVKYGNAEVTDRFNLIEYIPGLRTSFKKRGTLLVDSAYSTNLLELTNDPNREYNNIDWISIVAASQNFDIDRDWFYQLEVRNINLQFFDCRTGQPSGSPMRAPSSSSVEPSGSPQGQLSGSPVRAPSGSSCLEVSQSDASQADCDSEGNGQGTIDYVDLLVSNGYREIADSLRQLTETFKNDLSAIGTSNAYLLHLRCLEDSWG